MSGEKMTKYKRRNKYQEKIAKNSNHWFFKFICNYKTDGDLIYDNIEWGNIFYELNTDIGYYLFYKGKFEDEEINYISNKLKNIHSPILFDIGANIGLHSVAWSKDINNNGKIFAFEPSKNTRKILVKNIEANNKKDIISVIPKAVSNECGTSTFFDSKDNAYSSLKDTKRKPINDEYEIETITLDQFIKENLIEKIDIMKIDVEGFETEVIEGSRESLILLKPDIFVEIYEGVNSNINAELTINKLKVLGYVPYLLKNGVLTEFEKHDDEEYNYYFIHETKL